MKVLLPLLMLLPLSAFAAETILSDDILKVGECVKDDLKSGRQDKPSTIYWMVYDDRGVLIGSEMPSHQHDTFRVSTPDRTYVQMGSAGKPVFHEEYRFEIHHKIKKEVFERNWLFKKVEGSEKIVVENTSEFKSHSGEADVRGDETDQRAQKNIADFTAKQKCETAREKFLNKVAKSSNPAINDDERGVTEKESSGKSSSGKKPSTATKQ